MPKSERERTANCQSTRLDVQICNLATTSQPTRTCSTFISFSTLNSLLIYADFRIWFELYRFAPHLQNYITVRTPHESLNGTGSLQWHYQKLTLLITAFIAVWLSHWGLRQWPCNAILPTHATFTNNQLFYNFSSDIQEAVLVHSGILNVADMSATSNMPQCPAARTRHICHADKSARFVRCATVSSYLIYVTIYL